MSTVDDITALILDDHAAFRRGFARLDDARDEQEMLAIWDALALHLDIHAEAEEAILYPHLVKHGDDGEDETADAIGDHNKIRDAVAEAKLHPVGSDAVVGGGRHRPPGEQRTPRRRGGRGAARLPPARQHRTPRRAGPTLADLLRRAQERAQPSVPRQGPAAVRRRPPLRSPRHGGVGGTRPGRRMTR